MVVSQFSLAGATVYMSGEKGKFAVKQNFTYPIDFQQSAFSLADVNGDSVPDLLVLNAGSLGIYLGKGNGTFESTPFFIGPGEAPGMILTENLHGQAASANLPDIVLPDSTGGVMVLINTTK